MTSLRERFDRQFSQWSGAGAFVAWWWRSLLSWLPWRWRRVLGLDRGRLLLQPDGATLRLSVQDSNGVRELARVDGLGAGMPADATDADSTGADSTGADATDADPAMQGDVLMRLLPPALADLPRWLLLPADTGLRRRLLLPAAAGERLRDVVAFEVERQTPFTLDAVAFDARVVGRRDGDGQLETDLVVVPRARLDARLQDLGPLAGGLAGIDLAGDAGPLGVNLQPPERRRRQQDPWRTWSWVLAAVALLAFAAMLWQLLDNRERAAAALQVKANAEAARARVVAGQRQELVGLVEGRAFLDRSRSQRPTAIEVIDALSRRLPDNTYLEKLALENDRLLLIGLSSEASSLVGRLGDARFWRSPALTGAVQPDRRSGRDRFTLTAQLAIGVDAQAQAGPGGNKEARDADAPAD